MICETLTNYDILWWPNSIWIIIVLSFETNNLFLINLYIFGKRSDLPFFTQEQSQKREKRGFVYTWAEFYLQPNTVGQDCACMSRHYFYAVICRSCCVLLAIEKEEQFALNIIINFIASLLGHSVNVLFQEEYNVQSY